MATVIHVKGDGSGTIEQRLVFSQAALAQLKQLAMLDGRDHFNPLVAENAAADAAAMGAGVTFVSSTPINDETGQGRASLYSFTDINQLRVEQQPGLAGGVSMESLSGPAAVTVHLTQRPNGNALVTISVPRMGLPGAQQKDGGAPAPEQFALVKQMFAGARVSMAVEPVGTLVGTNSTYVEGPRVTLLDLNLDELLKDETLMTRIQAAKTADDMKAVLTDAPGLKINLEREITIEFTPAK